MALHFAETGDDRAIAENGTWTHGGMRLDARTPSDDGIAHRRVRADDGLRPNDGAIDRRVLPTLADAQMTLCALICAPAAIRAPAPT